MPGPTPYRTPEPSAERRPRATAATVAPKSSGAIPAIRSDTPPAVRLPAKEAPVVTLTADEVTTVRALVNQRYIQFEDEVQNLTGNSEEDLVLIAEYIISRRARDGILYNTPGAPSPVFASEPHRARQTPFVSEYKQAIIPIYEVEARRLQADIALARQWSESAMRKPGAPATVPAAGGVVLPLDSLTESERGELKAMFLTGEVKVPAQKIDFLWFRDISLKEHTRRLNGNREQDITALMWYFRAGRAAQARASDVEFDHEEFGQKVIGPEYDRVRNEYLAHEFTRDAPVAPYIGDKSADFKRLSDRLAMLPSGWLRAAIDFNARVAKNSQKNKSGKEEIVDPGLPSPEYIFQAQFFLNAGVKMPRTLFYVNKDGVVSHVHNPSKVKETRLGESWADMLGPLSEAIAIWQLGHGLPVTGKLDMTTVAALEKAGMSTKQDWRELDKEDWYRVRADERIFAGMAKSGQMSTREAIVGLARSQIGHVFDNNRGDENKYGWERIIRYYQVAFGSLDDFVMVEAEYQQLIKAAADYNQAKEIKNELISRKNLRSGIKNYFGDISTAESSVRELEAPTSESDPDAKPANASTYEALQRTRLARYYAFDPIPTGSGDTNAQHQQSAKGNPKYTFSHKPGPWSWCGIFVFWAVKAITGVGFWDGKPKGLTAILVDLNKKDIKPGKKDSPTYENSLAGAKPGDILAIRSTNSHFCMLLESVPADASPNTVLYTIDGNQEAQSIRESRKWQIKDVAAYYRAVND